MQLQSWQQLFPENSLSMKLTILESKYDLQKQSDYYTIY